MNDAGNRLAISGFIDATSSQISHTSLSLKSVFLRSQRRASASLSLEQLVLLSMGDAWQNSILGGFVCTGSPERADKTDFRM